MTCIVCLVTFLSYPHVDAVNATAQDHSGDTALHYICADAVTEEKRSPRLETVKVMLEAGCPVNAVNNDVRMP